MRKPTMLSLNTELVNGDGDTTKLIETIADDKAIKLEAWLDARTWRGVLGIVPFGGTEKIRILANESKALREGFSSTFYHARPTLDPTIFCRHFHFSPSQEVEYQDVLLLPSAYRALCENRYPVWWQVNGLDLSCRFSHDCFFNENRHL